MEKLASSAQLIFLEIRRYDYIYKLSTVSTRTECAYIRISQIYSRMRARRQSDTAASQWRQHWTFLFCSVKCHQQTNAVIMQVSVFVTFGVENQLKSCN